MNYRTAAAGAIAHACLVMTALAQPALELEEIVVSGGLTPVDAQSFARAVTIITAEEIERRKPRTFADALRTVPGVAVSRSGGPGGLTQVRIRGSEANHVLVLIDGVEAPDSSAGRDFSTLSPDLIDRIEVLRGPQSALYGAGATAGVINIITKGGLRGGTRLSGSVEGSSAPGGRGSALFQGGTDRADIGLGVSYSNDAGWDVSGDDGEKDGARDVTFTARGSADLGDVARVRANLRYADRTGEFDDTAFGCGGPACYVVDAKRREVESTLFLGGLALDVDSFGGALVHTPSVRYSQEASENTGSFGVSTNDTSTLSLGYQAALTFGAADDHTLVGAVQWKRETFENSFSPENRERDQLGYVLDYRGNVTDALFLQGGLRFDDNDAFGDFVSWSASASYNFFDTGTRLRASIGRAQTNPTFFEQFGTIFGTFQGNPDLSPERNFGWDVGIDQSFWGGRAQIGATYFNETLKDEIASRTVAGVTSPVNLDGESDRQGVELTARLAPVDGLSFGASYTYLDATEPNGAAEVRRPRHSGAVDVAYRFLGDRATMGAEAVWAADAVDFDFGDPSFTSPRAALDDYVVVNINASYALAETVEIYGGVRNLFNSGHQEVLGYAEQPIIGFIGLRASW
jgi:vitamin B12 transporter